MWLPDCLYDVFSTFVIMFYSDSVLKYLKFLLEMCADLFSLTTGFFLAFRGSEGVKFYADAKGEIISKST